jgi:hypothetical protein
VEPVRLLFAALFVAAAMGIAASLLLPRLPPQMAGGVLAAMLIVLALVSVSLFNQFEPRWRDPAEFVRGLEAKGLLTHEEFRATRAFQVEEFEDEGPHYFVELEDGAVLYLNGQYLFDYEPIEDDVELEQPRRFPCTEFTVRRHREAGYVVDIDCRGTVFLPEAVAPAFDTADHRAGVIPEDGQIIRDRSYDQLFEERLDRRRTR